MQGQELRALRKSMGMTQGQLASALGFSQGFIGEMERDEKAIEPRTVLALRGLRADRAPEDARRIPWVPVASIPDDWKDGRILLLWDEAAKHGPAILGWFTGPQIGWLIDGSSARAKPTYCAEITPPGGARNARPE